MPARSSSSGSGGSGGSKSGGSKSGGGGGSKSGSSKSSNSKSSGSKSSAAGDSSSFSPSRLRTLTSTDGVKAQLKALHEKLLAYEVPAGDDEPHEEWLTQSWPLLLEDNILHHKHKDVKLLAACCLVEVLAIYAPHTPFEGEQLEEVFAAIIMELRGLQAPDQHAYPRVYAMLESLATVKSCLCVVTLAESHGKTGPVVALFQQLLQSARPTHTPQAKLLMLEVMKACVETFAEAVPPELLAVVVEALLKDAPGSNSADDTDGGAADSSNVHAGGESSG
jgi:hypothetical protein